MCRFFNIPAVWAFIRFSFRVAAEACGQDHAELTFRATSVSWFGRLLLHRLPMTKRGQRTIGLDDGTVAVLLAERERHQRVCSGVPDGADVDMSLIRLPKGLAPWRRGSCERDGNTGPGTKNALSPNWPQDQSMFALRSLAGHAKQLKFQDGRVAEWFKAPVLEYTRDCSAASAFVSIGLQTKRLVPLLCRTPSDFVCLDSYLSGALWDRPWDRGGRHSVECKTPNRWPEPRRTNSRIGSAACTRPSWLRSSRCRKP
jgi:hypothetical protein